MIMMIVGVILFSNYLNYLYTLHNSSEYEGLVGTILSDDEISIVVLDKADDIISNYL